LAAIALFLPNTQEIMADYRPAVDFKPDDLTAPSRLRMATQSVASIYSGCIAGISPIKNESSV